MHTICQSLPSVINATPRHQKIVAVMFYVFNSDGMFVSRYHSEVIALAVARRIGGCVTRETVLF
jgi:hypothetical protein